MPELFPQIKLLGLEVSPGNTDRPTLGPVSENEVAGTMPAPQISPNNSLLEYVQILTLLWN